MQNPGIPKNAEKKARNAISIVTETFSFADVVQNLSIAVLETSMKEGVLTNRDPQAVGVACVSIAFGQYEQQHIPTEEFINETELDISVTNVNRARSVIVKRTNISVAPSTPKQYLQTICEKRQFPVEVLDMAERLIDDVDSVLFSGMKPASSVGAAIYASSLLTGIPQSQREIAEATNITSVPIRNTYRDILKSTNEHPLPDSVIDTVSIQHLTKIFKADDPEMFAKGIVLQELSCELGWVEGVHYRFEASSSTVVARVLSKGLSDLTGSDSVEDQMDVLESDFGLDRDDGFILGCDDVDLSLAGCIELHDRQMSTPQ